MRVYVIVYNTSTQYYTGMQVIYICHVAQISFAKLLSLHIGRKKYLFYVNRLKHYGVPKDN